MDEKTWPTHMLPTRDPTQNEWPTQTESEGLETNITSKWTGKKSWGTNIHIRQNRLQNKSHKERPRRTLHNTQGKNPSRRHKYYKHICTQHRSTQIHKENLEDFKKDIDSNILILGYLTHHCQKWIDLSNKIFSKILLHLTMS